MRVLIVFLTLLALCLPLPSLADDAVFRTFLSSRELLATFHFQVNSDRLTEVESKRIDALLPRLKDLQNNGYLIRVEGYASPGGDQAANLSLSLFRARNVAAIIEAKGLPAEITLTGYGDLRAGNDTPAAERRVEVVAYHMPRIPKKVRIVEKLTKMKERGAAAAEDVVSFDSPKEPIIDAMAIDQAIMEKIGVEPARPTVSVSRVDKNF